MSLSTLSDTLLMKYLCDMLESWQLYSKLKPLFYPTSRMGRPNWLSFNEGRSFLERILTIKEESGCWRQSFSIVCSKPRINGGLPSRFKSKTRNGLTSSNQTRSNKTFFYHHYLCRKKCCQNKDNIDSATFCWLDAARNGQELASDRWPTSCARSTVFWSRGLFSISLLFTINNRGSSGRVEHYRVTHAEHVMCHCPWSWIERTIKDVFYSLDDPELLTRIWWMNKKWLIFYWYNAPSW